MGSDRLAPRSKLAHPGAAAVPPNDTETVRMMIDAGVDVNAAATTGLTPLMLAAGQSNVQAVKMLLAKGANVNAVAADPSPQALASA